jgi:hypothetical protein
MTKERHEIVIEGSNDGQTWKEYAFRWKPGDVHRRPEFSTPHLPRLDWQMWFAALSTFEENPWFQGFLARLLDGEEAVLVLLEQNPFSEQPPRFVRAVLYRYRFTDGQTRARTGAWWQRELLGHYSPVLAREVGAGGDTQRLERGDSGRGHRPDVVYAALQSRPRDDAFTAGPTCQRPS